MSVRTEEGISASQRVVLAALADVLIPAADGMPAASEIGIEGKWLDRVLRARPDIIPALSRLLTEAEGRAAASEVQRLQEEDPTAFDVLFLAVAGGYYMNPKIRKRIGYPGQKPKPPYPDEADYYLRDGILDPVVARGPIYRRTPS